MENNSGLMRSIMVTLEGTAAFSEAIGRDVGDDYSSEDFELDGTRIRYHARSEHKKGTPRSCAELSLVSQV